jgi:glutathione peroxidase
MLPHRLLFAFTLGLGIIAAKDPVMSADAKPADALGFEMPALSGEKVNLADYKGKVVLLVNVASECGATPQYKELQALYSKYKDAGLVVLGFPCNQFGGQEPGSAQQIREFCTREYSITFPLFAKIDVNGPDAAPLYKHLTSKETDPKFAGKIRWNFEKFLIGRDGQIVSRFATSVEPSDPQVVGAIEAELAKK